MKFLRPRNADSGLLTVLLVNDAELAMLAEAARAKAVAFDKTVAAPPWKKLKAELETARKAL